MEEIKICCDKRNCKRHPPNTKCGERKNYNNKYFTANKRSWDFIKNEYSFFEHNCHYIKRKVRWYEYNDLEFFMKRIINENK